MFVCFTCVTYNIILLYVNPPRLFHNSNFPYFSNKMSLNERHSCVSASETLIQQRVEIHGSCTSRAASELSETMFIYALSVISTPKFNQFFTDPQQISHVTVGKPVDTFSQPIYDQRLFTFKIQWVRLIFRCAQQLKNCSIIILFQNCLQCKICFTFVHLPVICVFNMQSYKWLTKFM